MRVQEKINPTIKVDEYMTTRKESITSNSINQKPLKINKNEETNTKELTEKKSNKIIRFRKHFSIITLYVSGFNFPINRHRLADWM
jgi:hypothetical protein